MRRLGSTAVLIITGTALLGCSAAGQPPAADQVSRMRAPNAATAAQRALAEVARDDTAIARALGHGDFGRLKSLGQVLSADAQQAEEYVPPGYTKHEQVSYWAALADQIIAGYDLHRGDPADASAYLRAAAAVAHSIGR
jgi:hypothetical protein